MACFKGLTVLPRRCVLPPLLTPPRSPPRPPPPTAATCASPRHRWPQSRKIAVVSGSFVPDPPTVHETNGVAADESGRRKRKADTEGGVALGDYEDVTEAKRQTTDVTAADQTTASTANHAMLATPHGFSRNGPRLTERREDSANPADAAYFATVDSKLVRGLARGLSWAAGWGWGGLGGGQVHAHVFIFPRILRAASVCFR